MNASLPKTTETTDRSAPAGRISSLFGNDDFDRDVWAVLGLPFDLATAPQAVQAIEIAARDRRLLSFVTPNVNFLVRALADAEARQHILNADLSLVDGAPLVAIGKLLGVPFAARCAGSDVFDALRLRAGFAGRRIRVFFFGGREGVAEAAAAAVDAENRGVESAGHLYPGFGDVDEISSDEIINKINEARPDFILVALGAAKGQAWIDRNRARLEAPVIAHLGAVIDFASGSIRRAPAAWSRIGLEWAWRIKEDPSLWRRYWNDGLSLVSILFRNLAPALAAARLPGDILPADAAAIRKGSATVIALSGDLVASGRDPVRRAFREAAEKGADVVLDFAGARAIDPSFLGLVLMLEKNLARRGARIRTANLSRAQSRILAANAMAYDAAETAPDEEFRVIAAAG